MNKSYQQQYTEILTELINDYDKKVATRNGITRSKFFKTLEVDLTQEFPLMDIKSIKWSNILHELLWFINGNTNIKYLKDNDCNIWDDDAWGYYNRKYVPMGAPIIDKGTFIEYVKNGNRVTIADPSVNHPYDKYRTYTYGDMDRIYGKQWIEFSGKVNQLKNAIDLLKNDPDNRRIIVSAHNPKDIEDDIVGLPSCHNMFQFYTVEMTNDERLEWANKNISQELLNTKTLDELNVPNRWLSLWYNLRSNDFFLGQPYNTASYATLVYIIGNIVNMVPKKVACTMIDCHLYENHINAANKFLDRVKEIKQINQELLCSATLDITNRINDLNNINPEIFKIRNYNPHGYIFAPLLT